MPWSSWPRPKRSTTASLKAWSGKLSSVGRLLRVQLEEVGGLVVHGDGLVIAADFVGGLHRQGRVAHAVLLAQQNQPGLNRLREQTGGLVATRHVVHDFVGLLALLGFLALAERLFTIGPPQVEVRIRALLVVVERVLVVALVLLRIGELDQLLRLEPADIEPGCDSGSRTVPCCPRPCCPCSTARGTPARPCPFRRSIADAAAQRVNRAR